MASKKSKRSYVGLLDEAIDNIIKDTGAGNVHLPNYPSNIDLIDFKNARIEKNNVLAGFNGGKIIAITGKSGSGKTTLGLQIGFSIIKDFDEGQLLQLDYENASNEARSKTLAYKMGLTKKELKHKYKYLNEGIYTETLYKLVKSISKKKMELYDDLKIETNEIDEEGNTIYELPPTVILVDSWAAVIPEDIGGEEELSGNMSAVSIARQNNAVVKRIIGPCARGNIIIIAINHITKKVEIGPVKTSNELNYMGNDESTPGGTAIIYMADSWIRLQASSKLEEDKNFGIKGFYVKARYCKSRSNESGRDFELVFVQKEGFSNFLTNFNYLKKLNLLKGNGKAYYFDFDPNIKFTQKKAIEIYETNKDWAKKFDDLVYDIYSEFITSSDEEIIDDNDELEEDEEIELVECINEKKDIWLGSDNKKYYSDGTPYKSKR